MKHLKEWSFGIDNDKLVSLVLQGKKTATTSLYEIDEVPEVGEESILVFSNHQKAFITRTKRVLITEFQNIGEDLARLEGEGTYEEWKQAHISYFKIVMPEFQEDTKVIFEIFEVIK